MTPFLFFLCLCIFILLVVNGLLIYEAINLTKEIRSLRIERAAIWAFYDAVTFQKNVIK